MTRKHTLLMILCCLGPIGALVAISSFVSQRAHEVRMSPIQRMRPQPGRIDDAC